ncbi:hypothetical protein T484DRAFT_1793581 [Baffinella frigidus]|nr:hypothetical protein T484DRAFT_1793581 [Cryptophyta sp. CCMP2293]
MANIVNKPGGVPSIPRADNQAESCVASVNRHLHAAGKLGGMIPGEQESWLNAVG